MIDTKRKTIMKYVQKKLDNGLETLFINAPGTTSGSVQIWFKAGSALEEDSNQGIAHFLEHMFFKGTEKRPGALMAHEVESYGGEVNAFTSFDYTCYYINTPQSHINKTTDILLDMVSNPQFLQKDIEPEIGVVYEEYRRSLDSPAQFSFSQLQKSSFTDSYSHMILGNPDSILGFSRDQLTSFRSKFYNNNNAFLVIAGDLKQQQEIEQTINQYKLPTGDFSNFPKFKLKNKSTISIHNKEVRMAELTIAIQAPELNDPNSIAEDLAINCLGSGETSPLYKDLVIKSSLVNSASSSTLFMSKGGVHMLRIRCPYENLDKALNKLFHVIFQTVKKGFKEEDVKKIKNHYLASKIFEMESLESFAFSLGHSYAQSGDIEAEEKFLAKMKHTQTDQVNASIKNIFARGTHLSLQIPTDVKPNHAKAKLKLFQEKFKAFNVKTKSKSTTKPKYKITKSKFDPQVQLIELKKGLSLLYRQNTLNPTFVLQAYIKGGITRETPKTNGHYHLLSQLLTQGFKSYPYEKLKKNLEDHSASLHGFSGKNAYGLSMHGLSQDFSTLTDLFCGSLLAPTMQSKFLKHEKELAKRALENQTEDPIKKCFHQVAKLFFGDHPYSYNSLGSKKNIIKVTSNILKETHQANLDKNDMLLTYLGDLSLDAVLKKFEPAIKNLKSKKKNHHSKKKIISKRGVHNFIDFNREQTQIFYGLPTGPIESHDHIILKMLSTHLSGQSSELFLEVRDRQGLCYSIQPIHFIALEAGYWGIYMASGNEKVSAALKAIKSILKDIQENCISQKEFERIKVMIEGQNQVNIQTNDDYASIYSIPTLQGCGLDYYYKNNKKINELTYDVFKKKLSTILGKKWNTVIVGQNDAEV
jgi:zinc protease